MSVDSFQFFSDRGCIVSMMIYTEFNEIITLVSKSIPKIDT